MRKIAVAILVVFSVALVAVAASGPESINLAESWGLEVKKKAVVFPHALHQEKNECTECHATAEGGALKNIKGESIDPKALIASGDLKKGGTKNPIHDDFCWECHKEKKVPKGKSCSTCHK